MMKLNVYNRLEQAIVEYCTSLIKREVVFYAQSSLCLLKKSSAKDMETFSLKVSTLVFNWIWLIIFTPVYLI